jgi:bla regulator protein blaR1
MRIRAQVSFILLAAASLYGQTAAQQAFEVASIKPADPNARGTRINTDRRFVTIKNWTVKRLVQRAFGVEDYQVTGGPNWLDTYRFDISAKVDEAEPELKGKEGQERLRAMFESLLGERFQFQFHRETRQLPVYNLVAAKSGFKLTPAKDTSSSSTNSNNGRLTCQGVSMPQFAAFLSSTIERPVLDATGVPGVFDFKLEWSTQDGVAKAPDANELGGPSIFTALQEQLGLKLESTKGPVEIIVVDHAEKPTEN